MKYKPPRKPWAHQSEALAKMRGKHAFALFMGTRTGKTFTSTTDWATNICDKVVDDLCVIAPASYYESWHRSLNNDLSAQVRPTIFLWRASEVKEDDPAVRGFLSSPSPRVLIIDVEALATVTRAQELVKAFVGQRRCQVIVDESTTIKNPKAKAKQSNFVVEVGALAKFRRILTGLPTPRSPLDVWQQFQLLGPNILGVPSYNSFMYRYGVVKKRRFAMGVRRQVVAYRNLDHLRKIIEPYTYTVELDANREYERILVELTPQQKKIYDDLKKYASAELSGESRVTVDQVITQILRLHQVVCGHVTDDDGATVDIKENRTRAMLDITSSVDGKIVVWVAFGRGIVKVTQALEKAHGKGTVSQFWGGNRPVRLEEEQRFLQETRRRFMVATPAAAKFGREWRVSNTAIYHTNSDNLENRVQSEARTLAFDKDETTTYFDIVARGTVEEKIIDNLVKKNLLATKIDGRKWREWI